MGSRSFQTTTNTDVLPSRQRDDDHVVADALKNRRSEIRSRRRDDRRGRASLGLNSSVISIFFHHLQCMDRPHGLSMEALVELKDKTKELRTSLMATTVLVDASVATCNEWLSVVTDYVGPQINHISGKFLDHQVRRSRSPDSLYLPTLYIDI